MVRREVTGNLPATSIRRGARNVSYSTRRNFERRFFVARFQRAVPKDPEKFSVPRPWPCVFWRTTAGGRDKAIAAIYRRAEFFSENVQWRA